MPAQVIAPTPAASPSVTLEYRVADPYAVQLLLPDVEGVALGWLFARDLLADGLTRSVGDGDVRFSPVSLTGARTDAVRVALRAPTGGALVQLDAAAVGEFLRSTYVVCRQGQEAAHLDLDAALEALRVE